MATVTVISTFGQPASNPLAPDGPLLLDGSGNLLGTSAAGGPNHEGTVFELADTSAGYASAPTIVDSFDLGPNENPMGGLVSDAQGDLFGMTIPDPPNYPTTDIFEIAKTANGYASSPTVLATYDGFATPLVMDAAGDLFGATGTPDGHGMSVFELAKTANGFAETPITLESSLTPINSTLVVDAQGDVFGTSTTGTSSTDDGGSVFELAKTTNGYTYTALAGFPGADGSLSGALVADAAGNLFGTTNGPQASGGEIFEIAKTADGYASAPTVLADFPSGNLGNDSLLIDGADNLFVTSLPFGDGTGGELFELPKADGVYSNTVTAVTDLDGGGSIVQEGLIANSVGDLFGATGGEAGAVPATVYEITGSGFVPTSASTGETLGANNTAGQQLIGTALNDTFYAGQNSVVMTGNGGDDTFVFNALPWNAGSITDFNTATDTLNFNSIFASLHYTGSNPIADGYVQLVSDGHGDTQVYLDPHIPSDPWPTLMITLDGVSPASITPADFGYGTHSADTITISGTVANQSTQDDQSITPFKGVTLADTNGGITETLTVTLSDAANGQLSNLGGGSYDASTGIYTDTGTAAQLTAALDNLVFQPTEHQVAAGDTVTTSFTISDGDSTGASTSDSNTSVIATATSSGAAGETLTANDTAGQHLTGTPGNDIFSAEQNSVIMTGDGGDNTYVFSAVPWNAGQVTDFVPGADKLDISAILSAAGYSGSDPVADGWVTFQSDGQGDTQVYLNTHSASDPWPSLIVTLDGVSPTGLTAANTLGTAGSSGGGSGGGSGSGGSGGGSGSGGGTTVDDSQPSYTVPAGVTTVVLTGSTAQTVTANNAGDTITSNDHGSTIIGGTGNDTLIAGHGADMLTGGGGNDTFVFNYLPWSAGQITDFNTATDVLNLKGIFQSIGYTGSNPVADGYLQFADDGKGDTQVYVNSHSASDPWPTLVTTLDHVSPSAMHTGDYVFT